MFSRQDLTKYRALLGLKAFIYFAIQIELEEGTMKKSHVFDEEASRKFMETWGLEIKYKAFRSAILTLGDEGYLNQSTQMILDFDSI